MQEPVNIFAPDVRANPYPAYANLRAGAPVQQVQPGGLWAVSRHDDVEYVLKNPQIFSSGGMAAMLKPDWLPHNPTGDSLLTMDGSDHAKLRALVNKAFTPRAVARMEERVRVIAADVAARLATMDEVDFVTEFSIRLSGRVIADILGLDQKLHNEFRRWVGHLAMISPMYPGDELANAIRATIGELEGYLKEVVAARRRELGDDMVSDLLRAEVDGHALTDAEIVAFLAILMPAGFETTTHLFATMMLDFIAHPERFSRLREDPSQIPAYVEEALRKEPPSHGTMRLTTCETEIGGVKLPAGSLLLVLIGSANRDEARFPHAERFDSSRGTAGLAFGHGAHFCIGAPLARLEARIGLEELVARFVGFERLPGDLEWNVSLTVRGPLALPIRLLRAKPAPAPAS